MVVYCPQLSLMGWTRKSAAKKYLTIRYAQAHPTLIKILVHPSLLYWLLVGRLLQASKRSDIRFTQSNNGILTLVLLGYRNVSSLFHVVEDDV